MANSPKHYLLSRTDGIGDVILTLPMAAVIKEAEPGAKVSFLGRNYTRDVVNCCQKVDAFHSWDDLQSQTEAEQLKTVSEWGIDTVVHVFPRAEVVDLMHKAKIPTRVATARRWHTLTRVNKPLWYSRKKSDLHEAQLNLKMLQALGMNPSLNQDSIPEKYAFQAIKEQLPDLPFFQAEKKVVLHPLSHGSAVEWPIEQFASLASDLVAKGYAVAISGTQQERERMGDAFRWDELTDFGGKLNLKQLIYAISLSDGLIAASTGPLHIAAALGIHAVGLYTPKRPLHPGRWAPIGRNADFIVSEVHPEDGKLPISVDQVVGRILEWNANR